MLLKIISLLISLSLFSASASASTHQGLKTAFDEMSYALTVEWDQQDPEFYEVAMSTFRTKIRQLQQQGVSNGELLAFARSEVKDERVARDLDTAFSVVTVNKLSPDEATKYVVDTIKRSYSKGANWTGDPTITFLVGAIIIAIVLGLVLTNGGGGDGGTSTNAGSGSGTGTGTPACTYSYQCTTGYGYTYSYNCMFRDWDAPLYGYEWCYRQTCDNVCL